MKIIAECGCNWKSIEQAKEMIRRSKEVGCFAAKFQLFTEKEAPNLPIHLYLTFEQAKELFEYGKSINQRVFFTPMNLEMIQWCIDIKCEYVKIRYKDHKNKKMLFEIIDKNYLHEQNFKHKPIVSGGYNGYGSTINMLFCIPIYPAPFMNYYKKQHSFYLYNGISDHTSCLCLLELCLIYYPNLIYFEKHMKLEGTTPIENDWSISFKEMEGVLKK